MKKPYDQSDKELERSKKFLASKKHVARMFWSSETDMQAAFAAGDLWIAYAWPADWAAMKAKGLKVAYMQPKEGAISWIGMLMLGKGTKRPEHAHAFANSWSSKQVGSWLEDNYAYGHANTLARPKSKDLLKALQLTNPRALLEPYSHIDRDIPRRREYAQGVGGGQGVVALRRRIDPTTPSLLGLPLAWLGVFFLLPVALVAGYSLDVWSIDPGPHSLTLAGWRDFFDTPVYLKLFWKSIKLSLIVSVVVVLLAYPVAYYLAMSGTRRKYTLLLVLIAPFLTSYLLRVLAWKVALGNNGVLNTFMYWTHLRSPDHPISQLLYSKFAVILVLVYIWVPFVALPIFVSLESMDRRLLEAAADLGSTRWQAFWRVTLPLSLPGRRSRRSCSCSSRRSASSSRPRSSAGRPGTCTGTRSSTSSARGSRTGGRGRCSRCSCWRWWRCWRACSRGSSSRRSWRRCSGHGAVPPRGVGCCARSSSR